MRANCGQKVQSVLKQLEEMSQVCWQLSESDERKGYRDLHRISALSYQAAIDIVNETFYPKKEQDNG
jgi:hypothetical protein